MRNLVLVTLLSNILLTPAVAQSSASNEDGYLTWTAAQAEKIAKDMRASGKVGSAWTARWLHTERAINYKLRATLFTPEVIRASARLHQLRKRLTDDQTRALVGEAEKAGDLVVMIELDPNEGSGVIPVDWSAFLQPKGLKPGSPGAVAGVKASALRDVAALSGVMRRDYDYDVFWVVFPLVDEKNASAFPSDLSDVELVVGIHNSEGRVSWRLPESIRRKLKQSAR